MNCKQAKENLFDLLGPEAVKPESAVALHVAGCAECAADLASLKSTMSILDEWKAPAESPYFNTRLQARLAEARREDAIPQSWAARLWTPKLLRPALVAAMGLAFIIGMNFYQPKAPNNTNTTIAKTVQKGTAVADLQALDKNEDLYAEFDLLDDVGVNHAPQAKDLNDASQL
jgi:hypothetical protein